MWAWTLFNIYITFVIFYNLTDLIICDLRIATGSGKCYTLNYIGLYIIICIYIYILYTESA